jgi:hypothetical protein
VIESTIVFLLDASEATRLNWIKYLEGRIINQEKRLKNFREDNSDNKNAHIYISEYKQKIKQIKADIEWIHSLNKVDVIKGD